MQHASGRFVRGFSASLESYFGDVGSVYDLCRQGTQAAVQWQACGWLLHAGVQDLSLLSWELFKTSLNASQPAQLQHQSLKKTLG